MMSNVLVFLYAIRTSTIGNIIIIGGQCCFKSQDNRIGRWCKCKRPRIHI